MWPDFTNLHEARNSSIHLVPGGMCVAPCDFAGPLLETKCYFRSGVGSPVVYKEEEGGATEYVYRYAHFRGPRSAARCARAARAAAACLLRPPSFEQQQTKP